MGMKKLNKEATKKTAVWPIRDFRSLELFKVQKWKILVLILALEKSRKDKKGY